MSVNKVILIGNIGKDPDQPRVLGANNTKRVLTVSLATSEVFTDSKTGERRTETEWHRVEFWDNLADIAYKFLKTGSQVYVEGKIRTEKWVDKEGINRQGVKIRANQLTLLGSRQPNQSDETQQKVSSTNASDVIQPDSMTDDLPF